MAGQIFYPFALYIVTNYLEWTINYLLTIKININQASLWEEDNDRDERKLLRSISQTAL